MKCQTIERRFLKKEGDGNRQVNASVSYSKYLSLTLFFGSEMIAVGFLLLHLFLSALLTMKFRFASFPSFSLPFLLFGFVLFMHGTLSSTFSFFSPFSYSFPFSLFPFSLFLFFLTHISGYSIIENSF